MKDKWPERRQRHMVQLSASVTRADGTGMQAEVTDLSLEGCCLSGRFRIGETVTVKLPRIGKLEAEIRWAFLERAGARFIRSDGKTG